MSASTRHKNEQALEFVENLEQALPTSSIIQQFTSSDASISIPGTASTYDDIAELIMNLKKIECIDDVYVSSITSRLDDKTNKRVFDFQLTCEYAPLQLDDLLETAE
jgi:type IV pilus assembly protein PilM